MDVLPACVPCMYLELQTAVIHMWVMGINLDAVLLVTEESFLHPFISKENISIIVCVWVRPSLGSGFFHVFIHFRDCLRLAGLYPTPYNF